MTHHYKVEVTRDGRWWMVNVPELDQLTQARRIGEVEEMARSLIAISTGTRVSDIAIDIVSVNVPAVGDIASVANNVRQLRTRARDSEAEAAAATIKYSRQMADAGIPVRDIAQLLGISLSASANLSTPDLFGDGTRLWPTAQTEAVRLEGHKTLCSALLPM